MLLMGVTFCWIISGST